MGGKDRTELRNQESEAPGPQRAQLWPWSWEKADMGKGQRDKLPKKRGWGAGPGSCGGGGGGWPHSRMHTSPRKTASHTLQTTRGSTHKKATNSDHRSRGPRKTQISPGLLPGYGLASATRYGFKCALAHSYSWGCACPALPPNRRGSDTGGSEVPHPAQAGERPSGAPEGRGGGLLATWPGAPAGLR